ncbi:MAG: two-component system chemotaxis sensor kinase CheA [Gammaproteobacteria bacterium]|jgi:two-component system chemotaxis sensor kinase CheA
MAIDLDDEILQDFLIEAGEIVEQLNGQLVDLEQSPEDFDLLNTIFRGFHTIKGGGSFLSLKNLVELCHQSEDVFDLLRNRELILDSAMMDAFLRVLDEVNKMFDEVRHGVDPTPADSALLQSLIDMQNSDLNSGGSADDSHKVEEEREDDDEGTGTTAENAAMDFVASDDEITDEEFELLLDSLQEDKKSKSEPKKDTSPTAVASSNKSKSNNSDEISDEEFEALLDSLHDVSAEPKVSARKKGAAKQEKKEIPIIAKPKSKADEISDDEFESLLDDLHGKGQGPKVTKDKKEAKLDIAEPEKAVPSTKSEAPKALSRAVAEPAAKSRLAVKPKAVQGETTVRVDTVRLDEIMNLVGELVLARNRLNTLKDSFEDERVHKAISNLDVVTGDLQTAVMKTRMQPIKKVFGRFPRVVRDMARNLNKEISLEMKGEETDLDKNLVEALADPLVHLVRNSVDHGIETPDIREAAGKSREGTVILAAQQEGDHILLSISDDGAGMDPEILRSKVVEKGLMDEESASRLDDNGCFDLIFMPGLSTKQEITDVSGRGVGMDVVKTKITQLNGMINIDSTLGQGTTLTIKVPLTLAILPTLMVQLGTRKFALPLSNVSEIFELNSKKVSVVDGRQVVLNRGKAPPIFYLRSWLLNDADKTEFDLKGSQVIMVQMANTQVGLVVDHVIGQEEVVIKPLGAMLQGLPGIAGSTITGDGNIAIILDVQGLLKRFS